MVNIIPAKHQHAYYKTQLYCLTELLAWLLTLKSHCMLTALLGKVD